MMTLNDISSLKSEIVEELKHDIRCKGFDNVNVYEVGQYVDMVKDLAQAEKDCMEKCYYESVVDAMNENDYKDEFEVEAAGRMGYDTRRYSNGRYAPKGAGHYSPVHGYTPQSGNSQNRTTRSQSGTSTNTRYGYMPPMIGDHPYDMYVDSKMYYTETKDSNAKDSMDHHAKEHLDHTVESMKDIWMDADPELKKEIKGRLSKLVAEMQV